MELVGCTRHHAAWTLRCWGITVWEQHAGRPVKIVVGRRRSRQRTARIYDQQTVAALTKLWRHFGYLCGKRLAATLRLWLPHYEGWNARSKRKIALTPEVARQAAAHQPCDHRPVAARRETQTLTARAQPHEETHRNADVANSDPHLQRVAQRAGRHPRDGSGRSRRWQCAGRVCLHLAGHRPLHAMDGDARGAQQGSEVGVRAAPGGAPPAPLRVVGSPLG